MKAKGKGGAHTFVADVTFALQGVVKPVARRRDASTRSQENRVLRVSIVIDRKGREEFCVVWALIGLGNVG